MKLFEIIIRPIGGFGTLLKGDTIFGHFCWQAAYDPTLLKGGIEQQLQVYPEKPFAVFSSAVPRLTNPKPLYVLKRPDMPHERLFPSDNMDRASRLEILREKKKKKWMVISTLSRIDLSSANFMTDVELFQNIGVKQTSNLPQELIIRRSQPHNVVNRLTGTRGTGLFSPYSHEIFHYFSEIQLTIFVLIDENATDIDSIHTAMERIGKWGFGRDASIGMGRFEVISCDLVTPICPEKGDACYTLAPSVPETEDFSTCWFIPFVRFGKHGDRLARSSNPFKNPVLMADEGAVLKPKDASIFQKPYIGRAVANVSILKKEAFVQGYAPYLPVKME